MMQTPAAEHLLTAADDCAAGRQTVPGLSQSRAICLLVRQALEQVVDGLLSARQLGCPSATTRSRLICLGQAYADRTDIPQRVESAWHRLSTACHHHAYELSPTIGEARALIADVWWLAGQRADQERTEHV